MYIKNLFKIGEKEKKLIHIKNITFQTYSVDQKFPDKPMFKKPCGKEREKYIFKTFIFANELSVGNL